MKMLFYVNSLVSVATGQTAVNALDNNTEQENHRDKKHVKKTRDGPSSSSSSPAHPCV